MKRRKQQEQPPAETQFVEVKPQRPACASERIRVTWIADDKWVAVVERFGYGFGRRLSIWSEPYWYGTDAKFTGKTEEKALAKALAHVHGIRRERAYRLANTYTVEVPE